MSANELRPYPAYRDSGVEWLGKVPEHWEVRRLKASVKGCFNGVWGRDPNGQNDLLCVRVADFDRARLRVRLVTPTRRAIAPAERGDRLLKRGDLLLEKSGGGDVQPVGVVILYDHDAEAVCSNFIARMPTAPNCDSVYFMYLHSLLYRVGINVRSIKQTTGIQNLDSASYLSQRVPFPPQGTQHAIARFLEAADRRIQRYIRAKERLIELLEERKRALIHAAVTGRIDVRTGQPYPAYKDSGIDWLGKVPEHWEVRAAKWYFREANDRSTTGSEQLLSVSHITGVTPRSDKQNVTMFMAKSNVGYKLCASGDIVVNTMWAWMGALGIARRTGIVSPSYAVYRPYRSSRLKGEYANLLLRTAAYQHEYRCRSTGIRPLRLRLYPEEFLRIELLCPPPEEQTAIIGFLDAADRRTLASSEATNRQIELLHEYRTRLIADVVTGKLDVREATADLPETDSLATNRDGTDTNPTESNLHPIEEDMAKEAVP